MLEENGELQRRLGYHGYPFCSTMLQEKYRNNKKD